MRRRSSHPDHHQDNQRQHFRRLHRQALELKGNLQGFLERLVQMVHGTPTPPS